MAMASTAAAARMVSRPIRTWRLRCVRTSAKTGSIDVATRTTARTLLVGAVAALALLLVRDRLVQDEHRHAADVGQGLLRLERLHGPAKHRFHG